MSATRSALPEAGAMPTVVAPELQRELAGIGWMYGWRLAPGVTAPLLAPGLSMVHQTRLEMIEQHVRAALAEAGPDATAIDFACNEGWFSHKLLEWGASRVVGVDVREHNIRRATLVRDHFGIPAERLEFLQQDALTLDPAVVGEFDVVLVLGLIYHLEQPLEAIRVARRLTRGLCVIESQLVRQHRPALFSNGSPDHLLPLPASFGAYVENDEDNALASFGGIMSLVPNAAALEAMPRWAGFGDVERLTAAAHHDSQYVHGNRGIVATWPQRGLLRDRRGRPLPPTELARRVGEPMDGPDPMGDYVRSGESLKRLVSESLPADWTWQGKRALDFGCGAGRVLRHFEEEAGTAELFGCDIDESSIEWLRRNLAPPFRPFTVGEAPGTPLEDEALDLVWALSVFTHLTDHWAGWLLELHRVLRPGGLLMATFLNKSMADRFLPLPWQEDRTGMLTIAAGTPWDLGGPAVFHSEWWLRAHWGRAFDVVSLDRNETTPDVHGWVVLRKRAARGLTTADLERPEPDEPREFAALQHNLEQLHALEARRHG